MYLIYACNVFHVLSDLITAVKRHEMRYLTRCNRVVSPVPFIVQVDSQGPERCHHLHVSSMDVHLCVRMALTVETFQKKNGSMDWLNIKFMNVLVG